MSSSNSRAVRRRVIALVVSSACLVTAPLLRAQQQTQPRNPRIGYLYPAGGRRGATFQLTLGGQFLDGAARVRVFGGGVHARVIEHKKPMSPKEFNELRDKLKEIVEKDPAAFPRLAGRLEKAQEKKEGKKDEKTTRTEAPAAASPEKPAAPPPEKPDGAEERATRTPLTAEDRKLAAEIRDALASAVRRPANPAIGETVSVEVTIDPDAALGERELRLETALGLTNPLAFWIGSLPESSDPPAKVRSEQGAAAKPRERGQPAEGQVPSERTVALPAVVNGQILPGEVDRIRFTARRGQNLVIVAHARRLIPYLPDAVPGWFQATLALFDAQRREVAYDDDFRFDPDPVLHYVIPADGDHVVEVKDSIFRGREDFVYRLTLGDLSFVTSIFPLGGRLGERTSEELRGWNLPSGKAKLDLAGMRPGVQTLSLGEEQHFFNRVPFVVDTLTEHAERETNEDERRAQRVSLPLVVNGRIDRPGDRDRFRFDGRSGQRIVAEVQARRLGSPLDSMLRLTDASGTELATNDDHEDKAAGLETHHADSLLSATLPADGAYFVHLSDVQNKGGDEYAYRLRISAPRPDFELRVVPASVNARPGMTVPITIYVLRKDGFADGVSLALEDAPDGCVLSGGAVPPGENKIRLTLTVPWEPQDEPMALRLEGRATVEGRKVRRRAVPAEDMMQAFAYRQLVPAQEWLVAVPARGGGRRAEGGSTVRPVDARRPQSRGAGARRRGLAAGAGGQRRIELLEQSPVELQPGAVAQVHFAVPRGPLAQQVRLELNEPPEGVTVQEVAIQGGQMVVVLSADREKLKPGLQGNLIFDAYTETDNPAAQRPGRRRVPLGCLPAVPFRTASR